MRSASDWALVWQVVYEYIRITTHPRVHARPLSFSRALGDLQPYLAHPRCHVLVHTPQHGQILEAIATEIPQARGNFVHDCHYAALLKEHGVRVLYSADTDFRKFRFLDVRDPTVD